MRKLLFLTAGLALAPAIAAAQMAGSATSSVVPVPETKLPLKHTPQPTTAAITAADLMTRLYIFADDSMQGREAGTIGNVKGTDYIAAQAAKIGLKPAGENGTWFQTLPFKTRTVDQSSSFSIGGTPLAFGSEWVVLTSKSVDIQSAPIVFGGTLGDSAHMIDPAATTGKIVVFKATPATARASRNVARLIPGAVAIVVVGIDQFMPIFGRTATFVDDPALAPAKPLPPTIILATPSAAKLFDGAFDSLAPGTAGKTGSLSVTLNIAPTPYPARNVVGILPGSDPKLKGEYVAVGGHNDHIGLTAHPVDHDSIRIYNHIVRPGGAENSGNQATPEQQTEINSMLAAWRTAHPGTARLDSISNGADDDGTGSVSVLEIAQKMASLPHPKRSILFVWHVGEEKGLLGSAYYTDHPTVTRDSIVAQLNIDMVGRGDAWDMTGETKDGALIHGNNNYLQLVGSRRLSTELGNLAETVNTQDKHGLVFDYSLDANGHPQNIYCRSDHYEYARYGIPIIFFTTGGHSDYHQVTDEPQYIDYDHMARVDNFIEDLAEHVANMDHRPVVDQPKPDPRGVCRQ